MTSFSISKFFTIFLWFTISWKVHPIKDLPSFNHSSSVANLSPELSSGWSNNATRLRLTFSADIVVSAKYTIPHPAEVVETFISRNFLPSSFTNYQKYPSSYSNDDLPPNQKLRGRRLSLSGDEIKLMQIIIPIPDTNVDTKLIGNLRNLYISFGYDPTLEKMKPNGTRPARVDVGKQSYCTEMAWLFAIPRLGRYVEVIFKSLTFQLFPYNDGAELSGVVSPVGSEDEVDTDEDDRLSGLPLLLIAGGIVGVLLVGVFCVVMDTNLTPIEVAETFIPRDFIPSSFDNYRRYPPTYFQNESPERPKRSTATDEGKIKLVQIIIRIPYTNLDPQATGKASQNQRNLHISFGYDPQAGQYRIHIPDHCESRQSEILNFLAKTHSYDSKANYPLQ
ncbi:hypothetical protein Fcan01_17333 [Folsomia candida]|uniref:Uncharacterized protein n=1 Tax=Folsomia candida TaxID=158441 RepID=A0A226DTV7_FOLCA|nr:hypothetical protein Fcan01_17333 [Folsomia candida]